MEERNGKIWHKVAEEKPTESGRYVCIVCYGDDAFGVQTLPYYTTSGKFNCAPNSAADLEICPAFWAKAEDLIKLDGCDLLESRADWIVV